MKKTIKLGLIRGRHIMPVDDYIINSEIPKDFLSEKNFYKLFDLVYLEFLEALKKHESKDIDLYLTGLGRVQHLVINFFKENYNGMLSLYDYDSESEKYFRILQIQNDSTQLKKHKDLLYKRYEIEKLFKKITGL